MKRILAAGLFLLVALSALSLALGASTMTLEGLLRGDSAQLRVMLISRLPRLLAILTAGMSMSVVGLIMQQLARNKFVSPSTAGTTESASLGILVATIFFGSAAVILKMLIAFAFALAGTAVFMRILERARYKDAIIVPLIGIMFGGVSLSIPRGKITSFIGPNGAGKSTLLYQLSGGQRQRAFVAMVLCQNTEYILLDEPLNNLDLRHAAQMMHLLRRMVRDLGKTIVLVLHDINFASCHSDQIVALKGGRIVCQGGAEQIIEAGALRAVYDMDIHIETINGNRIGVYFE